MTRLASCSEDDGTAADALMALFGADDLDGEKYERAFVGAVLIARGLRA